MYIYIYERGDYVFPITLQQGQFKSVWEQLAAQARLFVIIIVLLLLLLIIIVIIALTITISMTLIMMIIMMFVVIISFDPVLPDPNYLR